MANSKIYTLWDLLQNTVEIFDNKIPLGIEVPMIQRDYAQGREDVRAKKIRKNFLDAIYMQLLSVQNGIENVEPLELDFVYGYLANNRFIPLDGQQRLTTLYLVHWYLFFNQGKLLENLETFGRISYRSRVSSSEFFECLNQQSHVRSLYEQIEIKKKQGDSWSLASVIKDQSWFHERWMQDPTIQSVMVMLEDIASKFGNIKAETLLEKNSVGFYLIDIPENGKGDSLYIKMNARGKGLTDFENLKAILEGAIHAVDLEMHERFSQAIDRAWLDKVWTLSSNLNNTKDRSKASGEYLLALITSITELLFHKANTLEKNFNFSEELMIQLYSNRDNIAFLIESMEHICARELDSYDDYFSEIYAKHQSTAGRVRHGGTMNVIGAVLEGASVDATDRLLFFAWLIYCKEKGSDEVSENLRDYLRVCRNYLNNINQKNRRTFSLTSEIRFEDFGKILAVLAKVYHPEDIYGALEKSSASSERYIGYEQTKYEYFQADSELKLLVQRLEDNWVFRGLLFNIELKQYSAAELSLIVPDFLALMDANDTEGLIRLLISLGYTGTHIADTSIGEMRLWGRSDRWHRVMASPDGEIRESLAKLFELFITRDRNANVQDFCNSYWKNIQKGLPKNSLNWYLLEYPVMTKKAIFTIANAEWEVPTIEAFDVTALIGYHCNPFVLELREREELTGLLNMPMSYAQYSNYARLRLNNGLSLSQANHSWVLHDGENMEGFLEFRELFNLEALKNREYRFSCNNLIEDVIPFILACANLKPIEVKELKAAEFTES
ncbi:DUF262 domain-containing protein [Pedobacter aquatilis]|uniref:DUF262 domain-containing protein n=1 Tax=Pedobacter aquatilis TaxID=351343 RepID=UPI0029309F5C|nr:DUF262 domain-containing protein [Pedobacter aquatilis]